ncbi:tyrosine-type recombinase/integrase [Bosea sp. BH3]|uniref:tyrosine-type recombinase/integrase n=1 Tax=Bosea sp. BH3 TaxID=2871701 RepID=UPI0021CAF6AC|nr:tyrosine-type recombinase/integrase [Bosea sp. BH3]MCU4179694.1 tyrosine-type recombinase/integrase [Bosea sp. BH3]
MSIRSFDPARRSLPFNEWPVIDQQLWTRAIAKRTLFGEGGTAAHWRPRTKVTNIQNYGRFLGYLAWSGQLDPHQTPAERATLDVVERYHEHTATIVSPVSQLSLLVGLKVTLKAMHPEINWRWLQEACNRLQIVASQEQSRRPDLPCPVELDRLARAELAEAREAFGEDEPSLKAAARFRDALCLALLVRRPLRATNFSTLRLGHELKPSNTGWNIMIAGEQTKNGAPIMMPFPIALNEALAFYLATVRPCFPHAATADRLWLCKFGVNRNHYWLHERICKVTQRLTGRPINPHQFRAMGATHLAEDAPDDEYAAANLLLHRHLSTTKRYYIRANTLRASRRIDALLNPPRKKAR